jgi:exodeoxyribonuclease-3
MKLYSWNVNGIRAVLTKGALQKFIDEHDPDVLCLQETKAERGQVVFDLPQYDEHFFSAVKKGYSGTAILSKVKPIRYVDGFPGEIIEQFSVTGDSYGDPNAEGRVIAAEYAEYWVVTCYTRQTARATFQPPKATLQPLGPSHVWPTSSSSRRPSRCCTVVT